MMDKAMTALAYLGVRMREASSWAGAVGFMLSVLHVAANPDLVNAGLGLLAAICGVVAVLVPEK